ncbi:MAG: hypothetical protein L0216_00045 [Planctomycetales bacterium]|nr:hypothetical protein [Planctomycetales bacterium]
MAEPRRPLTYDADPDWPAFRDGLVALHRRLATAGTAYPVEDARSIALANARQGVESAIITVSVLGQLQGRRMSAQQFAALIGATKIPPPALEAMCEGWEIHSRLSTLTWYQFQVENLLSNVLRALGQKVPWGFRKIAKAVVVATQAVDPSTQETRLLVPAFIRNSFHANGLHTEDDYVAIIDGVSFDFCKDSPVRCAGWQHVTVGIGGSLTAVEAILVTARVKALPTPIRDAGTWASFNFTGPPGASPPA